MRKSFAVALLLVLVLTGLIFTPYGIPGIMSIKSELQQAESLRETAQSTLNTKQVQTSDVVRTFEADRTFGVECSNIEGITGIINSINGVSTVSVTNIDPSQGYAEAGFYKDGDTPSAVLFELHASDIDVAVDVVESLQLPLVELRVGYPDTVEFIFLTGGEVSGW